MQRDTSLDTANSKVYGTTRIWDVTRDPEAVKTIEDADSQVALAERAAADAVRIAIEATQRADKIRAEQAEREAREAAQAAQEARETAEVNAAADEAMSAVRSAIRGVTAPADPTLTGEDHGDGPRAVETAPADDPRENPVDVQEPEPVSDNDGTQPPVEEKPRRRGGRRRQAAS